MWFPTPEEIIAMHDDILRLTGGEPGVLAPGGIGSAIERARSGTYGKEPDLAERAAFLLRGIAQDHPFAENKRTAFEATDVLVRGNGWFVEATRTEVVDFMLSVAKGDLEVEDIAAWLRSHLRRE